MTTGQGWVPVALGATIEAATSAGSMIDGAEIVIWRDSAGRAHVWEDRCPHRGMRMSFGFVRGDHIACLYHGWQYDTAGQCRHIPAHPDLEVPATIKVATYAAEERAGMIWTCLTDHADLSLLPEIDGLATPVRSLYVDRDLAAAVKALEGTAIPDGRGEAHAASIEHAGAGLLLVSAGPTRLLVGCQSLGDAKSALHMAALGASEATPQMRKALARWAEVLRVSLEAAARPAFSEVA